MKETWRWFGPQDPVTLEQIKQTGASGIVSALHHLYRGEPWPFAEVQKRKAEIKAAGFVWSVVESIPIHNSIKLRNGLCRQFIDAWKDSLAVIAKAGVEVVCYNFMPVVDWTRTDLKWRVASGGYALRFDAIDFAAYDMFILQRKGAQSTYDDAQIAAARARFESMPESRRDELEASVIGGLPGAEGSYTRETIRRELAEFQGVSAELLRNNLIAFLRDVLPVAEELCIRLAIHPDDPPWPLFGLPRVVSTAEDMRKIFSGCETQRSGLTFCAGSFGARPDNDLVGMVRVCPAHPLRASTPGAARDGRIVPRIRPPRRQLRYSGNHSGPAGRRSPATERGPSGLADSHAARPRASAGGRHSQEGQPRIFSGGPPERAGRVARRDVRLAICAARSGGVKPA